MASQIARLTIPADGGGGPTYVVPDWFRGRLYFASLSVLRSYRVAPETQAPLLSSLAYTTPLLAIDVDPVTGAVIAQRPAEGNSVENHMPLWKYDPLDTFAVAATIGAAGAFGGYPTHFWIVEWIVCVGCGTLASGGATQIGYAVMKESAFSGQVSVVRTDGAMSQAGFTAALVSGATNNRAIGCRGKSGPAGASVFLTWRGSVNGFSATVPLYVVEIAPGAETYNPASWPATNPHITSRTVGTIAAASIDPAWTLLSCQSIGYDRTDGNVLMLIETNEAVANKNYIVKVNANTATVIWATAISDTNSPTGLPSVNVTRRIAGLLGPANIAAGTSVLVNTGSGSLVSEVLGGLIASQYFQVSTHGTVGAITDDVSGLYFVGVEQFDGARPNAPVPVAGTPASFNNGYAFIAGLMPLTNTLRVMILS